MVMDNWPLLSDTLKLSHVHSYINDARLLTIPDFELRRLLGHSKREATRQLDESLRRLQTDRIDLVQHHEVIRFRRST